jgi:hypothetical protein
MVENRAEAQASTFQREVNAMRAVGEALSALGEDDARARVLAWAASHFGLPATAPAPRANFLQSSVPPVEHQSDSTGEIAGVAKMTASGFELTARDLKARSTNDAAIRIAHVVIYAYEKLTGEKVVSSKRILLPILRQWRAYDGNTRPAIANHKGIHRDGDNLSLDAIARKDAEKFIVEILDDSVEGTWNPKGRAAKRKKKDKVSEKERGSDE